ncbi:MAG: NADH-quinone oxidoreductase subunit [Halanaerobiales bacterium]|nr:NADH-quinone oxidoreductase subunit [Halanaerobiales bacterium]
MNYANFLERMHNIQDTYGYIPECEIDKVAREFNIPRSKVYGTIRFYSMFYTEPTGKYIIRVCDSLSCHINESKEIVEVIKDYLGIDNGETTEDRKFTLEIVECLGHCGEGPVMMVNDHIYTHVSKTMAIEILDKCV